MKPVSQGELKKMNIRQLEALAAEIRKFLIETVADTGGHLASNLGVVELTLAIHYVFDFPEDKIVWDVGHQSYVHKMLTGRLEQFSTLRKLGGLSGFPKRSESEFDFFDTGHSSTSISAALGMARARDLAGGDYHVAAVIGDGALTGGMAFEALNDAGELKKNFIVILNDNEMSISPNVGALSTYLTSMRAKPAYLRFKQRLARFLRAVPLVGNALVRMLKKVKDGIRHLFTKNTLFEQLGFTYLGPTDGHNIATLIKVLRTAKKVDGPVLIHAFTKKGRGYQFAEENPSDYHGVNRFSVQTGKSVGTGSGENYSAVFGKTLASLAKTDDRVCAITAAMPVGTGLELFAGLYPERFFDVGIAEQHAACFAAGLAAGGYTPVFAVYSSFLQRAYDQIVHDVCLQNLKVVFAIDRAGLVGEDGETHQGVFDLAFLCPLPNMAVLAPSSFDQLRQMLRYAVAEHDGPIAVRYPRGNRSLSRSVPPFRFGRACELVHGARVLMLSVGHMAEIAMAAAEKVKLATGVTPTVTDLRTVKPLDEQYLRRCGGQYELVVTVEDGAEHGGVGEAIAVLLRDSGCKVQIHAHRDPIVPQGRVDELYRQCGLDSDSIARDIQAVLLANEKKGKKII